jgi:hypothetical protein
MPRGLLADSFDCHRFRRSRPQPAAGQRLVHRRPSASSTAWAISYAPGLPPSRLGPANINQNNSFRCKTHEVMRGFVLSVIRNITSAVQYFSNDIAPPVEKWQLMNVLTPSSGAPFLRFQSAEKNPRVRGERFGSRFGLPIATPPTPSSHAPRAHQDASRWVVGLPVPTSCVKCVFRVFHVFLHS